MHYVEFLTRSGCWFDILLGHFLPFGTPTDIFCNGGSRTIKYLYSSITRPCRKNVLDLTTSELSGVNKLSVVAHEHLVLPPISEVVHISKTLTGRANEVSKNVVVLWKEGYSGLTRGKPHPAIANIAGLLIPDA